MQKLVDGGVNGRLHAPYPFYRRLFDPGDLGKRKISYPYLDSSCRVIRYVVWYLYGLSYLGLYVMQGELRKITITQNQHVVNFKMSCSEMTIQCL